jgi:dihydroflavonol-4-reductase
MTTIDKTLPVLVTGATGYVAGWIVKKLLESGTPVHAAVRDPQNKSKIAHLEKIAAETKTPIKFFKSDLLKDGSYAEAMQGCQLVYHTASPFTSNFKDAQKDLVDPAVKGTANVLNEANRTPSVRRVVLTSSVAAIYSDAIDVAATPKGILTEEVWNTTSSLEHNAYSFSKTLAEQEAWRIAKAQNQWDLVVVNPSFVLGPMLNPTETTSESFTLLKQMGDGGFRFGVPNVGIGVVDVRDLADIHFSAGFTPQAAGRNISNGHNSSFVEMAAILKQNFGKTHKISDKPLPKWLLVLFGPLLNKSLTRKYIRNNVNHAWKADNSKSIKELGAHYRPLSETMVDAFQVLIDHKIL